MADKPEALRCAEWLDSEIRRTVNADIENLYAAAELRRLHAENASLKRALAASCDEERDQIWEASPGGGCSRARSAEAVNAELLEALNETLFHVSNQGDVGVDQWLACERKARAAIAKAEEQK
jgi:hypothetical protein